MGLCLLGSQAVGQAAASSPGPSAFPPPRAAKGEEEARQGPRDRAAEEVGDSPHGQVVKIFRI